MLEVAHDGDHVGARQMLGPAHEFLVKQYGLLVEAREFYERESRAMRRTWWVLVVAAALNISVAVWSLGGSLGWWG